MVAEEGVLIDHARLYIVVALLERDIAVDAGVQQRALLRDRLILDGTEVGQRISAGVVVVGVLSNIGAKVEDRVRPDNSRVGGSDIEGLDLGALIGIPYIADHLSAAAAATDNVLDVQVVIGVWRLKPGAGVVQVHMDGVIRCELTVYAIEDILLVALGVEDCELRGVEKAPGIQAVELEEVAP